MTIKCEDPLEPVHERMGDVRRPGMYHQEFVRLRIEVFVRCLALLYHAAQCLHPPLQFETGLSNSNAPCVMLARRQRLVVTASRIVLSSRWVARGQIAIMQVGTVFIRL